MALASIDLIDAEAVIAVLDEAVATLKGSPHRQHCVERLPQQGRLVVTGDLHDNTLHLAKVLGQARLDASPHHHVVLHELIHSERLINGLDFSHRMLVTVADLVVRHPGQVHPVLANHELSQMTGAGVSKGAGNSVELFNDAIEFVFGDRCEEVSSAINRFIAAMPIALLTDSGVCCSHSLPAVEQLPRFDLGLFERDLVAEDFRGPAGAAYLMVWGRRQDEAVIERLAEHWGVQLFCVGHQHVDTGIELRHRRMLILNTDHEYAKLVVLDLTAPPDPEFLLMSAIPLASLGE